MYTVQLNVHVQMSNTEELQVVTQIASKLDSIMEVAGIWHPVNSMTDRDRIVNVLRTALCDENGTVTIPAENVYNADESVFHLP